MTNIHEWEELGYVAHATFMQSMGLKDKQEPQRVWLSRVSGWIRS